MPRSGYSALHGVNPNFKKIRIVLYSPAEAYYEPNQKSKLDFFARIFNGFNLTLPAILAKSFTTDV